MGSPPRSWYRIAAAASCMSVSKSTSHKPMLAICTPVAVGIPARSQFASQPPLGRNGATAFSKQDVGCYAQNCEPSVPGFDRSAQQLQERNTPVQAPGPHRTVGCEVGSCVAHLLVAQGVALDAAHGSCCVPPCVSIDSSSTGCPPSRAPARPRTFVSAAPPGLLAREDDLTTSSSPD